MSRTSVRLVCSCACALLTLVAAAATPLAARQIPERTVPLTYMGVLGGVRGGFDYLFDGLVAGAQLHLQPEPWGRLVVVPNAEYEFRQGLRDWQAGLDLAVLITRGLYVGGGLAYRNTIYDEVAGRETRQGHSIVLGFREPPSPGRLSTLIELRWSVFSFMRPRTIAVGMNYPLLLFR